MIARTLVVLVLVIGIVMAVDEEVKSKTIEGLEQQKSELYKKINHAIDESVKSLLQANDSEAMLGLQYMRDLREHIKELNGSEKESNEHKAINIDSKSDFENRRSYKGLDYFKNKNTIKNPFDFEKTLKPKGISEREWKAMIENRSKMQQKLDMWITERQKEKERIKKYKMERKKLVMSGKYEKCPRFGYHGRKKKERNKNKQRQRRCRIVFNATLGKEYEKCIELIPELVTIASDADRTRKKKYEKNKYPCCRKCCKKSYMGCL